MRERNQIGVRGDSENPDRNTTFSPTATSPRDWKQIKVFVQPIQRFKCERELIKLSVLMIFRFKCVSEVTQGLK